MLSRTPPAERSTWIDTRPTWDGVSNPLGDMPTKAFKQAVLVFRSDVTVFAAEFSRRTGLSINAARIAVELHSEAITLGRWTNYPRSDAFFEREDIKKSEVYTKWRLIGGNQELVDAGFIDDWRQQPFVFEVQSAMRATPALVHLVEDIINAGHRPYPHRPERIIEFRNAAGDTLKTPDTAQVRRETRELNELNWGIVKSNISHACGVHLTRIYNEDPKLQRGGRCYAQGMLYQGWSRERRSEIVINGARNVEYDFGSTHGSMLYRDRGLTPPSDAYDLDFWNRDLQKTAFNILINAANEDQAIYSLARKKGKKGMAAHAIPGSPDAMAAATQLIGEMKVRHRAIADAFCSDSGAYLQKREADIIVSVMLAMRKRGETCLPVHDSIMCREWAADWLVEEMRKAADRAGLFGIRIEKVEVNRAFDEDAVEDDYPVESMGVVEKSISYSFLSLSSLSSSSLPQTSIHDSHDVSGPDSIQPVSKIQDEAFVESSVLENSFSPSSQIAMLPVVTVATQKPRISDRHRVPAPDSGHGGNFKTVETVSIPVYPDRNVSQDAPGGSNTVEVGLQLSEPQTCQKSLLGDVRDGSDVEVSDSKSDPVPHVSPAVFASIWKTVRPLAKRRRQERPKGKAKIAPGQFGSVLSRGPDGIIFVLHDAWPEIPF